MTLFQKCIAHSSEAFISLHASCRVSQKYTLAQKSYMCDFAYTVVCSIVYFKNYCCPVKLIILNSLK